MVARRSIYLHTKAYVWLCEKLENKSAIIYTMQSACDCSVLHRFCV